MSGEQKMRAMVLSAGKGTRMGKLSDTLPKPLVPVAGVTLLDRALLHLEKAGTGPVVVNVHHLADQLEQHLAPRIKEGRVLISDERVELLETAGGVKKALPLLGEAPCYIINSDALWTDGSEDTLARLAACFEPERMDCLLLLVRVKKALGYDGKGDFLADLTADQAVPIAFRDEAPSAPVMYGGIQIVKPSLYKNLPEGPQSNRIIWREAVAHGRLFGLLHTGEWMHVGTPEAIKDAEEKLALIGAA